MFNNGDGFKNPKTEELVAITLGLFVIVTGYYIVLSGHLISNVLTSF